MDGRRNNSGTKGNKGGRKPKEQEEKLTLLARAYTEDAIRVTAEIMNNEGAKDSDRLTAVKIILERGHGSPKQEIDTTSGGEKIEVPIITWSK